MILDLRFLICDLVRDQAKSAQASFTPAANQKSKI